MNSENVNTNQLYGLYCDYSDGVGNHGPVLKEFAQLLWQYKSLWGQWKPFHVEDINAHMEHLDDKYKKNLIFDAGIVLGILILHLLLPGNMGWFIISVISGVIMSVKSKDSIWWVSIAIVSFIAAFIGGVFSLNSSPFFFVFLYAMTGINAALAYMKLKKENQKMENLHKIDTQKVIEKKQIESKLNDYRDKLFKLLPELRKEYNDMFNDIVRKNNGMATKQQLEDWSKLPDKFWWEISPDVLSDWEKELANGRNEDDFSQSWEFQVVERPFGKEFQQAGFEFSPLESDDLSEVEQNNIYEQRKAVLKAASSKLFDCIGVVLDLSVGSETVSYMDYAYSDIQRLAKTMEWEGIRSDIKYAYENNRLSEKDYNSLISEHNFQSWEVYSLINKQVEKTYEQKKEIKTATFFWSGQMILLPDSSINGGYMLACYNCRFQHMFENLYSLKKYNITRILGDEKGRNVAFLAKMHQIFPNCR